MDTPSLTVQTPSLMGMADALSSLSVNNRKGLTACSSLLRSWFMARIVLLHSWVVAASLLCLALARADALIHVGNRNQLFIDHRFIARSELIALRMNPLEKLGLILDRNSQPWPEFQHTGGYLKTSEDPLCFCRRGLSRRLAANASASFRRQSAAARRYSLHFAECPLGRRFLFCRAGKELPTQYSPGAQSRL